MEPATIIKPNTLINNRPYYDIIQVAALIERSTRTVQRIAKRNGIEYIRIGRAAYFEPKAVDEFIEKLKVKAKKFLNKGLTK